MGTPFSGHGIAVPLFPAPVKSTSALLPPGTGIAWMVFWNCPAWQAQLNISATSVTTAPAGGFQDMVAVLGPSLKIVRNSDSKSTGFALMFSGEITGVMQTPFCSTWVDVQTGGGVTHTLPCNTCGEVQTGGGVTHTLPCST
jgi:hypothetical protein